MWWASTPCTTMIWIWLKVDLSKENSRKKSSRKKINRFDNKISHFLAWLVNSILKGGGPGYVAGLMEVDVVWTIVNCQEKKAALFFQSKFDKNVCFFVFTGKVGVSRLSRLSCSSVEFVIELGGVLLRLWPPPNFEGVFAWCLPGPALL